ncbi:MAG: hypothetical protein AAF654_10195 [Myxococcota bacterium]
MSARILFAGVVLCACIDNTDTIENFGPLGVLPDPGGGEPRAIAVVGSDFVSTSISILDPRTGALFSEGIVDSGTTEPGLSTALSGDVVLPRTYNSQNSLVLLDRFPNSVLTFVEPVRLSVTGQLSVATGFASNPHDFLWLSSDKAYVTRYETNPRPGREPFDGGEDVLIVDPAARTVTGRVPLGVFADRQNNPALQARPDRMVFAEGLVWVTLNHLTGDFAEAGGGRVVGIDPETDQVVHSVVFDDFTNCSAIVYAELRAALFVACSGMFQTSAPEELGRSGIVEVNLSGDAPMARPFLRGADGIGRPYGFELEVSESAWLLAVRFGDLEAAIPDRLVQVSIEDGEETLVLEAQSAFGLGGLLVDDQNRRVYVGDADSTSPGIRILERVDGELLLTRIVNAHPQVGLPPRHIRFY